MPRRSSAARVSLSVSVPPKETTCCSVGISPRTSWIFARIFSFGTKQMDAPQSLRMYAHSLECWDSYIGT